MAWESNANLDTLHDFRLNSQTMVHNVSFTEKND